MLAIYFLGRLSITWQGEAFELKGLPKVPVVLAYLLYKCDQALSRKEVAFAIWPDVSEKAALSNLRRHLYQLKQALPETEQEWILSSRKTVQWNPAGNYWLDVAEFSQDKTDNAIKLYEGDLLPAFYDEWLYRWREVVRQEYGGKLNRLRKQSEDEGDYPLAISYAQLFLRHNPMREDVVRALMRLRALSGDRPGALREYRQFAQRLREEMDVVPVPETTTLYNDLAQSGTSVAVQQDTPLEAHTPTPPHNLPTRLTSFVGRESEIDQIVAWLDPAGSSQRLITLTGVGGTGKTSLALATANLIVQEHPAWFPDGVYFVDLSTTEQEDLIVPTINAALGLGKSRQTPQSQLTEHLANKRLLLILDNFEQLVNSALFIHQLTQAEPQLHILMTSRINLALYGELVFTVAPLSLPDSDNLPSLGQLWQYAAVALFCERAQVSQPSFSLTTENAATIVEICQRLDGVPLAIELAAARHRQFTLEGILARLDNRLAFLTGRERNRSARQRTLRATIGWSYNLLDKQEQELFACLGLFTGSFSLEAVEAILDEPYVDMQALVEQSMVQVVFPAGEQESRYRLLLTLREYAQTQFELLNDSKKLRQRYFDYFSSLATHHSSQILKHDEAKSLTQLDLEHDNFRAIFAQLIEQGEIEQAGILATTLHNSLHIRGYYLETAQWFDQLLTLSDKLSPRLHAQALQDRGLTARLLGEPHEKMYYFCAKSRDIWEQLGDEGQVARVILMLAMLIDYDKRLPVLEESLALFQKVNDQSGIAHAINNMGNLALFQGDYALAIERYEESLAMRRQVSGSISVANTLNNVAYAAHVLGDLDRAQAYHEQSLAMRRELGHKLGIAQSLRNLGLVLAYKGDYERAYSVLKEGWPIVIESNIRGGIMETFDYLVRVFIGFKRYVPAIQLASFVERLREEGEMERDVPTKQYFAENQKVLRDNVAEAVFALAWRTGRELTIEKAIRIGRLTDAD